MDQTNWRNKTVWEVKRTSEEIKADGERVRLIMEYIRRKKTREESMKHLRAEAILDEIAEELAAEV
jgi:hypothetical protein